MAVSEFCDVQEDNNLILDNDGSSYIKQSNYYDLDDFSKIMKKYNDNCNTSILNINARSLVKHFNEFSAILSDLPSLFDIITVEESCLSDISH